MSQSLSGVLGSVQPLPRRHQTALSLVHQLAGARAPACARVAQPVHRLLQCGALLLKRLDLQLRASVSACVRACVRVRGVAPTHLILLGHRHQTLLRVLLGHQLLHDLVDVRHAGSLSHASERLLVHIHLGNRRLQVRRVHVAVTVAVTVAVAVAVAVPVVGAVGASAGVRAPLQGVTQRVLLLLGQVSVGLCACARALARAPCHTPPRRPLQHTHPVLVLLILVVQTQREPRTAATQQVLLTLRGKWA